jgi:hypothetical protein
VKLERGDAVLIRTGWSKLMGKENERYGTQNAGIGIAAGQWLLAQEPMLIAADNCCVEVRTLGEAAQPADPRHDADPARRLPDRRTWSSRRWRAARAYEFAFIVQPLKLKARAARRSRRWRSADGQNRDCPCFYGMPAMLTRIL